MKSNFYFVVSVPNKMGCKKCDPLLNFTFIVYFIEQIKNFCVNVKKRCCS